MSIPADPRLLERNLKALARSSPQAAKAIEHAQPRPDAAFEQTPDGLPTGRITIDGKQLTLASARHPLREAERLAEQADPSSAALFAVLGFGLGYHVDAIVRAVAGSGLVMCYEPDVGLLRAVLERVDCTATFESEKFILVHEVGSSDDISIRLRGLEGVLALGMRFVSHPPSSRRLGESADRFCKKLVEVVAAAKTSIVTMLVQTEKTIENTLANARAYATLPGVNDLAGAIQGVPGIVVSAGPSLAQSLPALAEPGVRDRACIIAAQTVLKPLLERGIRPHFVTALDHHTISRRFYEGLSAEMVEGITLVAEPKANPAILAAWPGRIRLAADEVLDRLLGEARRQPLRSGSTVAHLSYFLARHLGCDPVVLVGQDLAYTDGLYYGPGASIHRVWAAELGEFRSLEMMEIERIGRARRMLRKTLDQEGQPVLTDEQLHNYLMQFEREFADDATAGLKVIDAGRGASKAHTVLMSLEEAIATHGRTFELPETPLPTDDASRVDEAFAATARQARELGRLSGQTGDLVRALDPYGDVGVMNNQVREIHELRDQAESLEPAYWLTQHLNQTGGLRRAKRDRQIAIAADGASDREVQAQRIERDADNLRWLGDAADRLADLLEDNAPQAPEAANADQIEVDADVDANATLPALVWFDTERGGLNQRRDLLRPIAGEQTAADLVLKTLLRCRRVSQVVLITTDLSAAKAVAERSPDPARVRVVPATPGQEARRRAIGAARALCPASFRGGLASLTAFDEVFDPDASLAAIDDMAAPGVLLAGADWALIDGDLVDRVAERLLVNPESRHIAFAQAPAGLAPCALARPAISEIALNPKAGAVATIGGLLGYAPHVPRADPIARDICVTVAPELRDLGRRLVPDSPDRVAAFREALHTVQQGVAATPMLAGLAAQQPQRPTHLRATLEEGEDLHLLDRLVAFVRGAPDAAATLDVARCGFSPFAQMLSRRLADAGAACVHVRTPLAWGQDEIDRLTDSAADIISVDVTDPSFPPPIESLLRDSDSGLRTPWIVPRLRRNEAMLSTLMELYDDALVRYGAAVIDAEENDAGGDDAADRLRPLPLPDTARLRLEREERETAASVASTAGVSA